MWRGAGGGVLGGLLITILYHLYEQQTSPHLYHALTFLHAPVLAILGAMACLLIAAWYTSDVPHENLDDRMGKIGILAYGSLIDDPGDEIKAATVSRIENVETPFKVEFARSSNTRGGAPTLVPVTEGGARVKAVVLILEDSVSERQAADILWRRETHRVGSGRRYNPSAVPNQNTVLVERAHNFCGVETVLYTRIAANIGTPTPELLAELAVGSARAGVVREGMDGISYLISARRHGILTPLMPKYVEAVLRRTRAETLEDALAKARLQSRS